MNRTGDSTCDDDFAHDMNQEIRIRWPAREPARLASDAPMLASLNLLLPALGQVDFIDLSPLSSERGFRMQRGRDLALVSPSMARAEPNGAAQALFEAHG